MNGKCTIPGLSQLCSILLPYASDGLYRPTTYRKHIQQLCKAAKKATETARQTQPTLKQSLLVVKSLVRRDINGNPANGNIWEEDHDSAQGEDDEDEIDDPIEPSGNPPGFESRLTDGGTNDQLGNHSATTPEGDEEAITIASVLAGKNLSQQLGGYDDWEHQQVDNPLVARDGTGSGGLDNNGHDMRHSGSSTDGDTSDEEAFA